MKLVLVDEVIRTNKLKGFLQKGRISVNLFLALKSQSLQIHSTLPYTLVMESEQYFFLSSNYLLILLLQTWP